MGESQLNMEAISHQNNYIPEETGMKMFWEDLVIDTQENNFVELDPKLKQFVEGFEFFYIKDLTDHCRALVTKSGIQNGFMTAQTLHTTTVISTNELDEPMLLMDIHRALKQIAPRVSDYLHNSPLRTANRCDRTSPSTALRPLPVRR